MKTRIILHATNTPSDFKVTLDDIMDLNSQSRYTDPLPYHYIVNIDGTVMKGKKNRELCGHCGKFSRDSISVAYAGGVDTDTEQPANTLNEQQISAMLNLLNELHRCYPEAEITGANALLYPADPPEDHEPFFDVPSWLHLVGLQ